MPLELSPHTRRMVEAAGCPNIATPKEADKVMRACLEEAERFLRRALTVANKSPMAIVSKVCRDLLMLMELTHIRAARQAGASGKKAMDVTALTRLLALTATSATAALSDMSFLRGAGVTGRCDDCGYKDDCKINKNNEDEGSSGEATDGSA